MKQGGSGTDVFAVTPAGGFSSTVTFTCGSGLPKGVSCSFSPASVTPSGSTPLTTTLTITTTGSSISRLAPAGSQVPWWMVGSGASLAILLLLPSRRRACFTVLAAAILAGGTGGCGSGTSGSPTTSTINPNTTPAGTYTIDLSATGGTLNVPAAFTLTVTQ